MAEGGSSETPKFSLVTSTDPLRHKLWKARQQGNFSDFQIEVNGVRIPCHKLIISVQSEYFNCMLQHENTAEVTQAYVDLKLLDVDAVKLVVDFMYSGKIEFEFHVAQEVIKVMDRFQLTEHILHEKISEYIIPHLCPDNCLGWFKFGEQMNLEKVTKEAQAIMLKRFSDVCKSSEFVSLSFIELKDYLQKVMQSHANHDQCLKAFVTWAMHDASERSPKCGKLHQIVNLKKCSASILKDIFENQGKVLLNNFDLLHQFTAALSLGISEPRDIIVAGGCVESKVCNRKTWILNLESGTGAAKASKTKNDCHTAICASPDGLISCGGTPTDVVKESTSDCVLYHKSTDTWIELPSLPAPTVGAGATCVQEALVIVVGGYEDRKNKTVCLDLRTRRSWTVCRDMLQGLVYPIVGSIDDCAFVIFSTHRDNETERNDTEISVQCYNTTTSTWTFKSPLPDSIKKTVGARVVTMEGLLYLVGGAEPICARYDPKCDNWTTLAPPRYSHDSGAALAVNGKIILSGGWENGKGQDNIEEYDPSNNTWRKLSVKLPAPLFEHCMILG